MHLLTLAVLLSASGLGRALAPEFGGLVAGPCDSVPETLALVNETYTLADPFQFLDGSRVQTLTDWACRAAQLRALFQQYELGWKPERPPIVLAALTPTDLTITTGTPNKTITFTVPISYPNTSMAGIGRMPAIITFNNLILPLPPSTAVLSLNVSAIAAQDGGQSRGRGLFYDLYGADHSAGALMAWAWATSRILDALELLDASPIDPERVAVTGCSRNGKGAMVAGAFDERIALTVPQESGSGGDACWRVSRDMLVNQGLLTQTASEIIDENVWFGPAFDAFGADNYTLGTLPVDHHELAGLVAPRGLYSTSNVGFLWLGAQSCYQCMMTANRIYEALGAADNHGFSQDGPHDHCAFPDDQVGEITAFYDKFLFGRGDADTSILRTAGNWSFDPAWVPWQTPDLR